MEGARTSRRGWWVGGAVLLAGTAGALAAWWQPAPIATCPPGTAPRVSAAPVGTEHWCERPGALGPVRDGRYVLIHGSGRATIEGSYREGLREGPWTFRYPSGRVQEAGVFRAGREHGRWTRWYPTGAPLEAGEYRDGVRQGRWTRWYEHGRPQRESDYRDGMERSGGARWSVKGERCDPREHSG